MESLPPSDLYEYQAQIRYTYIQTDKTLIYLNKINQLKIQRLLIDITSVMSSQLVTELTHSKKLQANV